MEIIYTFYFLCLFKKVIKKLLTFCYWTNKIISTHILTRRMTDLNDKGAGLWDISTHILTRRMTSSIDALISLSPNFNSHPHKEDDFQ